MAQQKIAMLAAALILALACNANAGAVQDVAALIQKKVSQALRWGGKKVQPHLGESETFKRLRERIEELPADMAFDPARNCLKRSSGSEQLVSCLRAAYPLAHLSEG